MNFLPLLIPALPFLLAAAAGRGGGRCPSYCYPVVSCSCTTCIYLPFTCNRLVLFSFSFLSFHCTLSLFAPPSPPTTSLSRLRSRHYHALQKLSFPIRIDPYFLNHSPTLLTHLRALQNVIDSLSARATFCFIFIFARIPGFHTFWFVYRFCMNFRIVSFH